MADEGTDPSWDDGIVTFVIRIRVEGAEAGDHEPGWLAHITNVLEQSERYVRDLRDLVRFIEEYLTRVGIGAYGSKAGTLGQTAPNPDLKE